MAEKTEKTYILTLKGGDIRKITIPNDWKITFGNVIPYQGKDARVSNGEYRIALRIYGKSKDDLRAVMMDVVSFREDSFYVMEKRTTVQLKAAQKQTSASMKDVVVEARVTEWVNPDKEEDSKHSEEFLKLPS